MKGGRVELHARPGQPLTGLEAELLRLVDRRGLTHAEAAERTSYTVGYVGERLRAARIKTGARRRL